MLADGLSTKVLNDCRRKHMENNILEKTPYPEVPPRVEYRVTPFGGKFIKLLAEVDLLPHELEALPDSEQGV